MIKPRLYRESVRRAQTMEPRTVRRVGPLAPKISGRSANFEHFTGGRFRHGTRFLRWRPEKEPRDCTFQLVERESRSALVLWSQAAGDQPNPDIIITKEWSAIER